MALILKRYWVVSYLFILASLFPFLVWVDLSLEAVVFQLLVYLTYAFLYLIPVMSIVHVLESQFQWLGSRIICGIAVLGVALVQVYLFADGTIFRLFDFHINGFVWNLITTPGGIASMGANTFTLATFAAVVCALALLQVGSMVAVSKIPTH